jgi:SAM-dependent methyltransferase
VRGAEPFGRDEGRAVFGAAADVYTSARPGYPERIYEILRDRCRLAPGSRVLEIGPGTGQATRRLLEAGATVVAVEPSRELAAELTASTQGRPVEVVLEAFEDVRLPPTSFDLAVAATAYHWLDPDRALSSISSALVPGGWVALWWNVFGDRSQPDPFHEATASLFTGTAPSPGEGSGPVPFALDVPARTTELTRHGFEAIEHETMSWTLHLDPARARALYATYSNVARLQTEDRDRILDGVERIAAHEFGGHVTRRMLSPIYTARKPQG